MIMFRTETKAQAETLMADDPLVKADILGFDSFEWEAGEGSVPVTIYLSDCSAKTG